MPGFPTVIQAIPIGVLQAWICPQLCLVQICQAIPVRITKRSIVGIWERLVLLTGLPLGINGGYRDVFAFYFRKSLANRDAWLPGVKGVKPVLNLPSIV